MGCGGACGSCRVAKCGVHYSRVKYMDLGKALCFARFASARPKPWRH